ncbi:MAG TPA: CPBP family intramembrane glutamic endopeptidase [Candidatus Sulfopaludibacter sp.]|nr:CPBP family intramembrane glutamic endopeptidase [Candidatus Sulfopaludibacter sp.]
MKPARKIDTISIVFFLLLAIVPGACWARFAEMRGLLLNPNTAGLSAWIAELTILPAALLTMWLRSRQSFRKIGWHWGPFAAYIAVAAATVSAVALVWAISLAMHAAAPVQRATPRQLAISLPVILGLSCFFAFAEEFGWRGFLLPKLLPLGVRQALLVSGLCWFLWEAPLVAFGMLDAELIHINPPLTLALHLLQTLSMAVVFGYLRLRFDSVLLPTFAHGLLNTMGALGFFLLQEKRPMVADFSGVIGTLAQIAVAVALLVSSARLRKPLTTPE